MDWETLRLSHLPAFILKVVDSGLVQVCLTLAPIFSTVDHLFWAQKDSKWPPL